MKRLEMCLQLMDEPAEAIIESTPEHDRLLEAEDSGRETAFKPHLHPRTPRTKEMTKVKP